MDGRLKTSLKKCRITLILSNICVVAMLIHSVTNAQGGLTVFSIKYIFSVILCALLATQITIINLVFKIASDRQLDTKGKLCTERE